MEEFKIEAEQSSGDLIRKPYTKPRLQVFGDLRTIIHGNGNNDPTQNDSPIQHRKSQ